MRVAPDADGNIRHYRRIGEDELIKVFDGVLVSCAAFLNVVGIDDDNNTTNVSW
jgi:hypothetical protein